MKKHFDKKLFYILLAYVGLYHIYLISKGVLLKLNGISIYANLSWKQIILDPLITNFIIMTPIIVLIIIINGIMYKRQYNWKFIVVIHLIFSILYILLMYSFLYIYQILTSKRTIDSINLKRFFIDTVSNSDLHFLGYLGFVTIIYCYYYINKIVKIEVQKTKLSEQLTNSKLEMLKAQLNPHFLFNTLHSISSLIKINQQKAQKMIVALGDLLREVIVVKHENTITLSEELDILKKYINIMLIRFSDHLNIDINVEKGVEKALVPTLMIQPIIENSIKHGYSPNNINLKIEINISKTGNHLVFEIKNNGKLLNENIDVIYGIGIKNSLERLETLYQKNYEYIFRNSNSEGVETIIKIPFQE